MTRTSPGLEAGPRRTLLDAHDLARALAVRDLTDPDQGPHAIQLVVAGILAALGAAWPSEIRLSRSRPLVPVEDNYSRLGYRPDAVTRDARYTRYVSETCMLRSHTSAGVPPALRRLAGEATHGTAEMDVLVACPGVVYRRDAVDRTHTGTPHQLDLWRVVSGRRMTGDDLAEMIRIAVAAVLPDAEYRTVPATHPYTVDGLQVDVRSGGTWVEIGECGLAAPHVLDGGGLDAGRVTGLAMGLGLDRLVMLRKGVPDIRLLRADDERISSQMLDLASYRPVSQHPPVRRDLSLAVAADADEETLGDQVRTALGAQADAVEEVRLVGATPVAALPPAAVARLGARPGQQNVLLRVCLRHPSRSLTDDEANLLRDRMYAALHAGDRHDWACGGPPAG
jgi:phenylalanyl-tRNA synthetase alpha chain